MRWVSKHSIQVDSVGVQIHTDNIWRGVVKVKVAGVHTHYKWTRSVEDACQRQRAQGDVGTLPLEGKDHLRRDTREGSDYYHQAHKKPPFCLFVFAFTPEFCYQTPELNLGKRDKCRECLLHNTWCSDLLELIHRNEFVGLLRIGTSCAFKDKQDMVGRVNYVHGAGESTTDHREKRTKVKYTEERQYSLNIT